MVRFSSAKPFEQVKRHRKLPERSHLGIEFPQKNGRVFRTYIPFLQNPIITERGQSNLIEYDLVGRAGSLYSYGGAKSRVISLQFKINLVHLLYTDSGEGIDRKFLRSFNLFYADRERAKKAFQLKPGGERDQAQDAVDKAYDVFSKAQEDLAIADASIDPKDDDALHEAAIRTVPAVLGVARAEGDIERQKTSLAELEADIGQEFMDFNTSENNPDIELGKGFPHAETHRAFYRRALGILTGGIEAVETPALDAFANQLIEGINSATFLDGFGGSTQAPIITTPQEQMNRLTTLIDCVYIWINLVRATTLNNATNTTQGPPIVRLTHGPMYNNIPCVVSDYNIEMTQEAGYEVETLTPKELVINMTLKEFRGVGKFEANQIEDGDNIAGWEAIIKDNNIDPYNGDINREAMESVATTFDRGAGRFTGV